MLLCREAGPKYACNTAGPVGTLLVSKGERVAATAHSGALTFHFSLNRSEKRREGCFDFSLFTDQKRRKDHHRLQWGFDKRSLSHVSDQALLAVVDMPIIHFILLRSFWSKTGARTSSNNEKLDSAWSWTNVILFPLCVFRFIPKHCWLSHCHYKISDDLTTLTTLTSILTWSHVNILRQQCSLAMWTKRGEWQKLNYL